MCEVYGENIKIVSVVDDKLDVKNTSALFQSDEQNKKDEKLDGGKDAKFMHDLLNTFGGKVVN